MTNNPYTEVARTIERAIEQAYPGERYMVIAIYITESDNQMRMICNTGEENARNMLLAGGQAIAEGSGKTAFKTPLDN